MGRRPWIVVALAAVLAAMLVPGSAVSVVQHSTTATRPSSTCGPAWLRRQRRSGRLSNVIGATVIWNRFGTPASLSKRGKFLATGIRGANAVAAARAWLNANKAILGLQLDRRPRARRRHATGREQRPRGQLPPGLRRASRRRRAASSPSASPARRPSAGGSPTSRPRSRARRRSHRARSSSRLPKGWRRRRKRPVTASRWRRSPRPRTPPATSPSRSTRLDSLQHVKLVSFPTPRGGVLPAYESLVVDKEAGKAHRIYVDARDGRLLARFPAVFNLADQELVPVTIPFSGDAAHDPEQLCAEARAVRRRLGRPLPARVRERRQPGPGHPPEALPGRGARRDLADVGFTPEAIQYEPTGGVPPGNYFAEVCVFGTPLEPRTYTGHVHDRRHAGPASVPGAVAGVPGQPAARHAPGRPVGQPEHRHARAVVLGRR